MHQVQVSAKTSNYSIPCLRWGYASTQASKFLHFILVKWPSVTPMKTFLVENFQSVVLMRINTYYVYIFLWDCQAKKYQSIFYHCVISLQKSNQVAQYTPAPQILPEDRTPRQPLLHCFHCTKSTYSYVDEHMLPKLVSLFSRESPGTYFPIELSYYAGHVSSISSIFPRSPKPNCHEIYSQIAAGILEFITRDLRRNVTYITSSSSINFFPKYKNSKIISNRNGGKSYKVPSTHEKFMFLVICPYK